MEENQLNQLRQSDFNPDTYYYEDDALRFFRTKFDNDELLYIYELAIATAKNEGYHKTKRKDYKECRIKIDTAFIKFDVLGFITEDKRHRIKNGRPYILSDRGIQFYHLFKAEILKLVGVDKNV